MGIIQGIKNVYKSIAGMQEIMNYNNTENRRGIQVFTMSQLMSVTGKNSHGETITGQYEQPYFYLSVDERINIFRLCAPVHAVIKARMNRISTMPYRVTCKNKTVDMDIERLKNMKSVAMEYSETKDMKYKVASRKLVQSIMEELPDVLPDLSNFDKALLRYSKKVKMLDNDRVEEIEEWLQEPNLEDKWQDFIKKWVFDLMVHGAATIYKQKLGDKIENLYILSGGSVIPLKTKWVGGSYGFVQIIQGFEPEIYFQDEVCYSSYIPSTARAYGFIPLEALINKVTESLLFDDLMAKQADGTKLPQKMVIVTDNSPFGSLDKEIQMPLPLEEQKRLENKLNTPKKGSVITFSGNSATVVDLSRENTMSIQMQRQKDIREEVALVFDATNMEMNLGGSDSTSGRETSEQQAEIMHSRGILPILRIIETKFNREILPYRFGYGYSIEFDSGKDEMQEIDRIDKMAKTGIYSINEIRVNELGEDPFSGEEYDKPMNAPQAPPAGQEGQPPQAGQQ